MDISVSYYSAVGARKNNEDAVSIQDSQNGLLAVVADGLGGHVNGEVASNTAVATVNHCLQNKAPQEEALLEAIEEASNRIYRQQEGQDMMKTTIAALWVGDHMALAANVGDSRIYQFRDGRIVYQSLDHSVAQMAVLVGEQTADSIRTNPDRNKLIRTLGNAAAPKVDCEILSVRTGDRLLICSDGFWEPVEEQDMLQTCQHAATAKDWLEQMRQILVAKNDPNQDNHTAVALFIND